MFTSSLIPTNTHMHIKPCGLHTSLLIQEVTYEPLYEAQATNFTLAGKQYQVSRASCVCVRVNVTA